MVVGLGVVGASVTIEGDSWKEIVVVRVVIDCSAYYTNLHV